MTSSAEGRKCEAAEVDGVMLCDRCGLEWLAGTQKPECDPVTWARIRETVLHHLDREETSAKILSSMKREGGCAVNNAADPVPCRRRVVDLRSLLSLLDRTTSSPAMKALAAGNAERALEILKAAK